MLIWICMQIGCAPPPPPDVIFVSQETLLERVYGTEPPAGPYVAGSTTIRHKPSGCLTSVAPKTCWIRAPCCTNWCTTCRRSRRWFIPVRQRGGAARIWAAGAVVDGKGHQRPLCRDGGRSVHDHASVTLLAGGVEAERGGENVLAMKELSCCLRQAGAVKNREQNRRYR